jgi:hypothetical protein
VRGRKESPPEWFSIDEEDAMTTARDIMSRIPVLWARLSHSPNRCLTSRCPSFVGE